MRRLLNRRRCSSDQSTHVGHTKMPRQGSGAVRQQDVHSGWLSHEAKNLPQPLPGRPGQDFWVGDVGSLLADMAEKYVFRE